jgi:hypothetical protein
MGLTHFLLGVVVGAVVAAIFFGKINIIPSGSDVFSTAFNIGLGVGLAALAIIFLAFLGLFIIAIIIALLDR